MCELDSEDKAPGQSIVVPIQKGAASCRQPPSNTSYKNKESTFPKIVVQYSLVTSEELMSSYQRGVSIY